MKVNIKKALMKLPNLITILSLSSAVIVAGCSPDDTQTVATFGNLVVEDDFNNDGMLDPELWTIEVGDGSEQGIPGWGNNELQFYTEREDNVSVENGYLLITAKKEDYNGSSYTSGRLVTRGKLEQQFGRVEARIRLPYGQGLWPAFWMLGVPEEQTIDGNMQQEVWPDLGEIDIMENRGQEPTLITGSVHGPGYSGGNAISKTFQFIESRVDTEFHIYGVEWGPNYINYYVDDKLYNQITPEDVTGEWVFNRPFYLILNLAIGGDYGGNPNQETKFPQSMLVDYVKVYN